MNITLHWYHAFLIQLWIGVYYAFRVAIYVRSHEESTGSNMARYFGAILLAASAIFMSIYLLCGGLFT